MAEQYEELSNQIAQRRMDYGQRVAEFPKMEASLRASMFGNDPTMKNLQSQEKDLIGELFRHDQDVATQYQQNPGLSTSPSGRVLDPYARELATSNRYAGTADVLTTNRQGQQTRRDVIGDSLQNALKLATQALEMKKMEIEALERDRDFAWEVFKEKNKKTGGGQGAVNALFETILGLQKKKEEAAPLLTKTTSTKAKGKAEQQKLVERIKKQYPGQKLSLTYNKNGTITYSVLKPKQRVLEAEEGAALDNPNLFNQLSGATVASGGSPTDVNFIMQSLGLTPPDTTLTRGQTQDQAVQLLIQDLQMAPPNMTPEDLFVRLKGAYPEVADSTIKNLMNNAGYPIF